jgi:hypothetical protein
VGSRKWEAGSGKREVKPILVLSSEFRRLKIRIKPACNKTSRGCH